MLPIGISIKQLTTNLVVSLKPDTHIDRAKQDLGIDEPTNAQIKAAAVKKISEAVKPLYDPKLRAFLLEIKKKNEQVIATSGHGWHSRKQVERNLLKSSVNSSR